MPAGDGTLWRSTWENVVNSGQEYGNGRIAMNRIKNFLVRHWQSLTIIMVMVGSAVWIRVHLHSADIPEIVVLEKIRTLHKVFNYAEAVFWFCVGVVLICRSVLAFRPLRTPLAVSGTTFLAFAGTDVAEVHTGAWYSPAWLLAWNTVCVVSLILCLVWYVRRKRGLSKTDSDNVEPADCLEQ